MWHYNSSSVFHLIPGHRLMILQRFATSHTEFTFSGVDIDSIQASIEDLSLPAGPVKLQFETSLLLDTFYDNNVEIANSGPIKTCCRQAKRYTTQPEIWFRRVPQNSNDPGFGNWNVWHFENGSATTLRLFAGRGDLKESNVNLSDAAFWLTPPTYQPLEVHFIIKVLFCMCVFPVAHSVCVAAVWSIDRQKKFADQSAIDKTFKIY